MDRACQVATEHDAEFTLEELQAVEKTGKDTAPGEDQITYTMIRRSGEGTKRIILSLITHGDRDFSQAHEKELTSNPYQSRKTWAIQDQYIY